MSKKLKLHIPTPCHENWDKMTPVEKGRFCSSCQKQVVDFTNMSDREIAIFFKKPSTGLVCGRFMQDQLDRDIEIPKKRIPWVKYFFQFALPAFLVSAKATAQGKVLQKNLTVQKCVLANPVLNDKPVIFQEEQTIRDTASMLMKKIFNDTIVLPEVVIVSYPRTIVGKLPTAFSTMHVKNETINTISESLQGIAGGISVSRYPVIQKDTLIKKVIKAIFINKAFRIYPNPLKSGSTLNIEWKKNEAGNYKLELFNLSGQLIFSKEIWIDEKARLLNIQIPQVAAGNYFLKMTGKTPGKSYTEKIIIQ